MLSLFLRVIAQHHVPSSAQRKHTHTRCRHLTLQHGAATVAQHVLPFPSHSLSDVKVPEAAIIPPGKSQSWQAGCFCFFVCFNIIIIFT